MGKNQYHKNTVITCKDHLVSGEDFSLLYDEAYDMLITNPQPVPEKLPEYYESDDYISHTGSRRSWFEKAYHLVKQQTLRKKVRHIKKLHPGKGRLLDIGAGTGDFLSEARRKGWEVYGTEPNAQARDLAHKKDIGLKAEIRDLSSGSYDVITLWHVLEHLRKPAEQLAQLKQLLKPKSTIIIAVPNFKCFDAQYYKAYWAAYDVPRHLYHFSKTAIQKLCAAHELMVTEIRPMYFDAFYVSLLSEKYKTGSMNPLKAFYIGWLSNSKAFFGSREYSSQIYVIKHQNNDFKAI